MNKNKTTQNPLTLNSLLYSKFNSQGIMDWTKKCNKTFWEKQKSTEENHKGNHPDLGLDRLETKTEINKRKIKCYFINI